MFLSPGTRFGTYEVIETLGSGGMGEVYRARDAKLRRDVALKVLPTPDRLDTDRQARFAREALSLAALNHPNIATVHGVEDAEGVQALVMELVEGQTLADRLERHVSGLPGVTVTRGPARQLSLALSPDGRTLVIAGTDGDTERLYVRTRTGPEAVPLAGTEGGVSPFFSPDGTWVGFFADRRLKRVPVGGGVAVDIARAPARPAGASWGANDQIVIAGYQAPLQVVEAAGGTPEDVLPGGPERGYLFPEFLPDGRTVLWVEFPPLLAAPFDAAGLRVTGPLVPVVEGVDFERTTLGAAQLAISREGTIAVVPSARAFELVLLGPDGAERLLAEHPMLENPRFSPTGRQLAVAVTRNNGERPDVWIHDLTGGSPAYRLTSEGGRAPV